MILRRAGARWQSFGIVNNISICQILILVVNTFCPLQPQLCSDNAINSLTALNSIWPSQIWVRKRAVRSFACLWDLGLAATWCITSGFCQSQRRRHWIRRLLILGFHMFAYVCLCLPFAKHEKARNSNLFDSRSATWDRMLGCLQGLHPSGLKWLESLQDDCDFDQRH